jgi:hypothetical protein
VLGPQRRLPSSLPSAGRKKETVLQHLKADERPLQHRFCEEKRTTDRHYRVRLAGRSGQRKVAGLLMVLNPELYRITDELDFTMIL